MDLPTALRELEDLGYRVDMIMPADDPTTATLSRDGVSITVDAPSGGVGRAGMEYRDLIPDRHGGRVIASHIRIPDGGPVPDSVHFHDVRFQVIVGRAGWVRVVYEDQGPPFVLSPGDVVLQPPGIRHRVLEASPGLEVIEVAGPARHPTYFDHSLALPTAALRPDRDFGGQRFVRSVAATQPWAPSSVPGWEARETAVASATSGLAGVRHLRPSGAAVAPWSHQGDLCFRYVTAGRVSVLGQALGPDDHIVVPADVPHELLPLTPETELLEITLSSAPSANP